MTRERDTLPLESDKGLGLLVREHLARLGIDEVGVDFDNTLIDTVKTYAEAIRGAAEKLVEHRGDMDLIEQCEIQIYEEIRELRNEFVVNPVLMTFAVLQTAEVLGLDIEDKAVQTKVQAAVKRVGEIFSIDKFERFEGAVQTLAILDRPVMITHAEEPWTRRKIAEAGIGPLLAEVVCMNVNKPKSAQWSDKLQKQGIDPKSFLMIGDNLQEDILLPIMLGGRGVWICGEKTFQKMIENNPILAYFENKLREAIEEGRLVTARDIAHVPEAILMLR